ncbi:hypothetical protein ACS0TY_022354 [Phlomoides rotata]
MGYIIADRIGIPHFAREILGFLVSDYYFVGSWHLDEFFMMKHLDIVEDMMHYSCDADSDTLVWPRSVHDSLWTKLAYAGLQKRYPVISWGNWIWSPFILSKRSTVVWRLIHGKLPTWTSSVTDVFLGRRNVSSVFLLRKIWTIYSVTAHGPRVSFRMPADANSVPKLPYCGDFVSLPSSGLFGTSTARERITAHMHNSPVDLDILSACKVKGRPPKAPTVKCVRWQPPPIGIMKINVDGSAAGSPGQLTCGGMFHDHYGVFRGYFTATQGCGFAFEVELATALLAIEIAHDKGWNNLWLESDSTYVVHFLKSDHPEAPWRLMTRWHRVRRLRPHLYVVVSHIFWEGNVVADRLSHEEVYRFRWWSEPPGFLFPFLQRDISLDFYHFTRF